jgi:hypothetical protein
MKVKNDFVTNSSSTCFILFGFKINIGESSFEEFDTILKEKLKGFSATNEEVDDILDELGLYIGYGVDSS